MKLIIPEDKRRLRRIFEPYLDGMKLKDDAPEEAKKALEEYYTWFKKEIEYQH